MKNNIHPQWYPQAKVSCACGNAFTVGAAKPEIKVDICAKCHPFYTGEMKYVDTLGRVERFQQKQAVGTKMAAAVADKKKKKKEKEEAARNAPKSLKEMLTGLK